MLQPLRHDFFHRQPTPDRIQMARTFHRHELRRLHHHDCAAGNRSRLWRRQQGQATTRRLLRPAENTDRLRSHNRPMCPAAHTPGTGAPHPSPTVTLLLPASSSPSTLTIHPCSAPTCSMNTSSPTPSTNSPPTSSANSLPRRSDVEASPPTPPKPASSPHTKKSPSSPASSSTDDYEKKFTIIY